jgi:2-methylfumaryl-CoA isomerase
VPRPLQGLRIIELSSFIAAPLGGMTLAQLGADVIRIEPPDGGADRRRWPITSSGHSLYWAGLNKGKRSVAIDQRTAQGRDLIARLITAPATGGGIVLTNAAAPVGLRYEDLVSLRCDLIYVGITGFPDGRTAVDYTVNASVGFAGVTGPEGHPLPVNHVLPAWDVACGLYAATGLLAAERARTMTGDSQRLSISLHDVALATAGNLGFLAEAEVNQVTRPRIGDAVYGTYGHTFETRDGQRIMVVTLTQRQWRDLVRITDTQAEVDVLEQRLGVTFDNAAARYTSRHSLDRLFEPWFAGNTQDIAAKQLSRTAVVWSRVRSFAQVVDDQLGTGSEPILSTIEQPGVGRHLAANGPIAIDGQLPPAVPAPQLGQHTDEVLRELLDLSEQQTRSLRRAGAIPALSA